MVDESGVGADRRAALATPVPSRGYVLGPQEGVHEDETIVVLDGMVEAVCGPDVFSVTPGHLDEFFRLKGETSDPGEIARLVQEFL